MFVVRSLLALSLVASSLAAHQDPYALHRRGDPAGDSSSSSTKNTTDTEPRRYIVEFHGTADSQVEATSLADRLNLTVVKVFNSDVFQGACVESTQDNLDMLKAQDPVAQAWHSKRIALAPMTVNQTYGEGAAGVNMSIHHMTGVDKLHAAGIRGKGVTVGIVDTGVLYTHPDLGGGFGPGFKVAGGYDLVGDSEWPDDPVRRPDNDPLDYLGHGTHVSGIIAGEGKMFTGVAPDATLRMYKVFSTIDSTSEDVLIEAFLMAYKDGSDIITSSIGSVSGWADNAWGLVASRLVEQGVVVTISAGNDGTAGAFAASSGSSGENVLAVASIDADILPGPSMNATFRVNGTTNTVKIPYRAATSWYPSNISNWPVVPLTLDTTVAADACSPLQNDTRDFTNQVVLVRRGGCNFEVKQKNLAAVNGTNALFYTNELPIVYPTTNYLGPGQLAMITREAGAEIIRAYKAGGNVTVDFTGNPVYSLTGVPNEETGGAPSYYTTLGATNELGIKPDIGAPGGYILSTYLKNGYGVLSGTSMACPYVAGVAALYIGKFGGRATHGTSFAKALAGRILSSGMAVPWNAGTGDVYDYGIPAPVAQVGTGLINATKVLDFATGLSFSKFALNDTRHFSRYHSVNITNTGATPITYTFSLQEYGGLNTFNTNASDWGTPRVAWSDELMVEPLRGVVPPVSFPRSPFTVQPGQTREAAIHFDPVSISGRTDTSAAQLPLYGGAIVVTGSNGETLSLPYQGLAANLETDVGTIFDYVIGFPTLTSTGAKTPIAKKANVTFNLDNSAHDYFTLYTRLRYASRELRWDIFDAAWSERDWVYPPVVGQHGYVGAATSFSGASPDAFFNSTSDDASDVITLPLVDQPRSIVGQYGVSLWWLGGLANGTQIAPGKYNMRIAALAPFGNPAHSDNWDVYKTPTIEVLPIQK